MSIYVPYADEGILQKVSHLMLAAVLEARPYCLLFIDGEMKAQRV